MVVLGGFLAGSVFAYLRMDDPRWYANAWTWLIAIPLVISGSLVALALTGNRYLRRTMQLSIVLGVIVHVIIFLSAVETDVFQRVWVETLASTDRPPQRQPVEVPDFLSWRQDQNRRARRDLERPVDVQVPEPQLEPAPRDEQPQSPPPEIEMPPQPEPHERDVPVPSVVDRAEPNQTQPRQRDEMSKLSRKEATVPRMPSQLADVPSVVPRPERRADAPQPDTMALQPQAPAPSRGIGFQPVMPQADAPNTSPLTRPPRQQRAPADSPRPTDSVARRDRRTPAVTEPTADAQAQQPAVAQSTPQQAPQPQVSAAPALRQPTRSPVTRERIEAPQTEITDSSATRRRAIEQPSPRRDSLARTPQSIPNRRPRVTTRPDLTALVDNVPQLPAAESTSTDAREAAIDRNAGERTGQMAAAERTSHESPTAAPAATAPRIATRAPSVTQPGVDAVGAALPGRRPADSESLGSLAQRLSPVAAQPGAVEPSRALAGPSASADMQVAKRAAGNAEMQTPQPSAQSIGGVAADQTPLPHTRRESTSGQPSLNVLADNRSLPRRALRESPTSSSPLMAESPTRAAADGDPSQSAAEPSSMALAKGETGIAGLGASRNLGHADASAASPASIASGSARRADATQTLPPGPALEPHDVALARRGRAGLARPSTVLEANNLDAAQMAGARQTGEVQASTSASLAEAASNAERGTVTASKGNLDVDTGPTTLVAQSGAGRGAGGGQPELSFGTRRELVSRAQPGTSPTPSLLADTTGAATTAPAGEAGGQPSAAALDAGANALVDSRLGPANDSFGGPAALGAGPLAVPTLSPANASRRAHGVLDETPQQDTTSGIARVARTAPEDRQLASPTGIADLSAGNAAQRSDDEVPAASVAASQTALEGPQSAGPGGDARPSGLANAPRDNDDDVAPAAAETIELAGRAEAVEAAAGAPQAGGGTASPARSGRGPEVVATVEAQQVELAGNPAAPGTGFADIGALDGPATTEIVRSASGADRGHMTIQRTESNLATAGISTSPGSAPIRRDEAASDYAGPTVPGDSSRRGPARQSQPMDLPGDPATVDLADLVSPSDMPVGGGTEVALVSGDAEPGPISRLAGEALPADIDAPVGPGGLGALASVDVGLPSRRSSDASTDLQVDAPRFNRNRLGGQPSLNPTAAMPTESFQRRIQRAQGKQDPGGGTGPQTEDAIELGLVFLSKAQLPDGRWSLDRFTRQDGLPQLASDSAATGLALLAFQGAGYNHMDFRYADVVRRGIDFLIKNQQPDGSLFVPMDEDSNRVVQFYSHSIAALAMCEAYGMTQDPQLREPAQRAIDFIVETQNGQRGGWRYTRGVSSDTSVTGWMMMALKSGELANLKVPKETYQLIDRWLDTAQASPTQPHLYCYNPFAPDSTEQRAGREPTATMTSVGLLMRLYLGWRRNNPAFARGAQYLARRPPAIGTRTDPQRDTYYWYYGTQVMFHMGGQYWRDWNRALHPLLIDTQIREGELAGSWDPRRPLPDRWALHAGRLYVTTMNLLSLEVAYRHLPLYEDTAK